MCCKKSLELYFAKKKIILYSTDSSFTVINACNQGKKFCSLCTVLAVSPMI